MVVAPRSQVAQLEGRLSLIVCHSLIRAAILTAPQLSSGSPLSKWRINLDNVCKRFYISLEVVRAGCAICYPCFVPLPPPGPASNIEYLQSALQGRRVYQPGWREGVLSCCYPLPSQSLEMLILPGGPGPPGICFPCIFMIIITSSGRR